MINKIFLTNKWETKMRDNGSNAKSFMLGVLIGGAVGALTALLFAPKSGRELRRDIADKSNDLYDSASDLIQEGKQKTQHIIDSVKKQADSILSKASDYYDDAKEQITTSTEEVQKRFDNLKEAAKAGADAFKTDLRK